MGFLPTDSLVVKLHGHGILNTRGTVGPCSWGRASSQAEEPATAVREDGSESRAGQSSALTPSPHMGRRQSASAARGPLCTCSVPTQPPSPALVLWGRHRGKHSETERGLLSRRETRDTWELAGEACEAGRTPGWPGGYRGAARSAGGGGWGQAAGAGFGTSEFRRGVVGSASFRLSGAGVPGEPRPAWGLSSPGNPGIWLGTAGGSRAQSPGTWRPPPQLPV